jgi:hypothetical protein
MRDQGLKFQQGQGARQTWGYAQGGIGPFELQALKLEAKKAGNYGRDPQDAGVILTQTENRHPGSDRRLDQSRFPYPYPARLTNFDMKSPKVTTRWDSPSNQNKNLTVLRKTLSP